MQDPSPDVTGVSVTSRKAGVRPCETCGEAKNDGRRECGKCRIARYRADPEKAERSREASRRWKGQEYARQLAAWNQRQEVATR
jgi:hypothetical protein